MTRFCSDECKEAGSICDFCKHYIDKYRDIEKLEGRFAGDGFCGIDNKEVSAIDGYRCDNFECFTLKD